jgi:hypothetical protein
MVCLGCGMTWVNERGLPRSNRAGILFVGGGHRPSSRWRPEFGSGRHPVRFLRLLQSHREFRCSEGFYVDHDPRSDQSASVRTNNPDSLRLGLLLGAAGPRSLLGTAPRV